MANSGLNVISCVSVLHEKSMLQQQRWILVSVCVRLKMSSDHRHTSLADILRITSALTVTVTHERIFLPQIMDAPSELLAASSQKSRRFVLCGKRCPVKFIKVPLFHNSHTLFTRAVLMHVVWKIIDFLRRTVIFYLRIWNQVSFYF